MQEKKQPDLPEDTSLSHDLASRIRAQGPVTVAAFMSEAAQHYYAAHEPFGIDGDFTTAPEISQMFGEMIGAWLTDLWLQMGKPEAVKLIELGPGRGTLSADILRTVSNWPDFAEALSLHLVETSPALRVKQAEALKGVRPTWYDRFEDVPEGPAFIIANEFFDALPVHQFIKTGNGWMERAVDFKGVFEFTTLTPEFDLAGMMPVEFMDAEEGSIFEISPVSLQAVSSIAARVSAFGGAALMIDYGHVKAGLGDTLQALKGHQYADPLVNPGGQDITAHVDFSTFGVVASEAARVHGPVTQGKFLTALGIMQRGESLREAAGNDAQRKDIETALFRLIAPSEMGSLFKVMALTPKGSTLAPVGFEGNTDEPVEN